MIQLASILDEAKIPYRWYVYTNSKEVINNPNVIFVQPRMDVVNFIKEADYLVQLSDNVERLPDIVFVKPFV